MISKDRGTQGLFLPYETAVNMVKMEEEGHWWFQCRTLWAEQFISRHYPFSHFASHIYFDLGCGGGGLGRRISALFGFERTLLVDRDPFFLKSAQEFAGIETQHADLEQPFNFSLKPTLVTAMDVIEHLKEDQTFVNRVAELLEPGGLLVLSVPAHRTLYSQWDLTDGHYRRYERNQVISILKNAGLKILEARYMWSVLAPLALYRKLAGRLYRTHTGVHNVPRWLNRFLITVSNVERSLTNRVNMPFGTSVIACAQKSHQ